MANPRRSSNSISVSIENNTNNPYQLHTTQTTTTTTLILSSLKFFLKKPHAFPFLLSLFLLLTWISLRLQHSPRFSSPPHLTTTLHPHQRTTTTTADNDDDDLKANLVRFPSGFPSPITKDIRGWLLDPLSVALHAGLSGGAVTCASVHLGEIRPGSLRGNHRHHTCNETFLLWGAKTKFRLENNAVDKGYAEVTFSADEVAVAASPHGTAHALINVDPVRSTFFLGCQDSIINYSNSTSDFNVWKDL